MNNIKMETHSEPLGDMEIKDEPIENSSCKEEIYPAQDADVKTATWLLHWDDTAEKKRPLNVSHENQSPQEAKRIKKEIDENVDSSTMLCSAEISSQPTSTEMNLGDHNTLAKTSCHDGAVTDVSTDMVSALSRNSREGMKLKSLSTEERQKILERIDEGAAMHIICQEFNITPSTFYDVKSNKFEDPGSSEKTQKRIQAAKYANLDQALYNWCKQKLASEVNIGGVDIRNAAVCFAQNLNIEDFTASSGWLFNFRSRHYLVNRRVVGKSASANHDNIEFFKKQLKKIIEDSQLQLCHIYSAGETGLLWKAVPTNMRAYVPGRKLAKDCLSILCCANADGTHRLKPMIVGKSRITATLEKIIDSLPVIYKRNDWACFTRELFHHWFQNYFISAVIKFQKDVLDIEREDVKAILLLDSASPHPALEELEAHGGRIKAVFMPANTSFMIHPMHHGVMEACKRHYRSSYLRECLVVLEDEYNKDCSIRSAQTLENFKKYNIQNALFSWADAWKTLSVTVLSHAWNKLLKSTEVEVDFVGLEIEDFFNLLHQGGETEITMDNIVDWLEQDMEEPVYDTKEGINSSISQEAAAESSDHNEDEVLAPKQRLIDLRIHLDKAIEAVEQLPDLNKHYATLRDIRADVIKHLHSNCFTNCETSIVLPAASGCSPLDITSTSTRITPEPPQQLKLTDREAMNALGHNEHFLEIDEKSVRPVIEWSKPSANFDQMPCSFDSNVKIHGVDSSVTPLGVFRKLFTNKVMDIFVRETNCYANNLTMPSFERWTELSRHELLVYIGINIFMSIKVNENQRDYWSESYWGEEVVRQNMTRVRYENIECALRLYDPSVTVVEQQSVTSVIDVLHCFRESFADVYKPGRNLTINESIIAWKGKIFRKFIKSKHARFDIKMFALCEADTGYYLNIFLFSGMDTTYNYQLNNCIPWCTTTEKIVTKLIEPYVGLGHTLYMDSFFNSPGLSLFLKKVCKIDTVGTLCLRRNEVPREFMGRNAKEGTVTSLTGQSLGETVLIQQWVANKTRTISMITTYHKDTVEEVTVPITENGNTSQRIKMKPSSVFSYNKIMTEVNKMDLSLEPSSIERGRVCNWFVKVFRRFLNIALHNSYVIYKKLNSSQSISSRDFRKKLVEEIFELNKHQRKNSNPLQNITGKGLFHLPISLEGSRKYCQYCKVGRKTRSKTSWMCEECKIFLCIKCFSDYHKQFVREI